MSLVRLENITKSYDPYLILDDISLSIEHGDRIGLIGRNGTGKTTLLAIIAGLITNFKGNVSYAKHLRVGYLSQETDLDAACTLRQEMLNVFEERRRLEDRMLELSEKMEEAAGDLTLLEKYAHLQTQHEQMGGYDYEHQINRTLGGLGFQATDFNLDIGVLSGGQKSRAALAKLLLEAPDVLLLDEPTNHLDIKAIEWLENFLNTEFKGAVVIASHDRYFLDRVARKIAELDNHKIKVYRGNYAQYLETRRVELLTQEREYKKQQQFIAHEEDFIRRNMAGQRTREAQGRQKLLDRLERVEKPQTNEKTIKLQFTPEVRGGNDILQCRGLGKRYGAKEVFHGLNFDIYRQDIVGIIGPNGVGKTTLFRMILGTETPTSGTLKVGQNLHFGYYDQELQGLNKQNTVIEEIQQAWPEQTQGGIRNFLGRFLFSGDEVFKVINDLSGGEQSRVMLAKLLLQNANVLLLDEPTNHLDIPSREALEQALAEYPSTIFIISHDRYFLNRLVNKLLVFENGTAKLFVGNYAAYEAHLQEQRQLERQAQKQPPKTPTRETLRVASSSKGKKSKKKQSKAVRIREV